MAILLDKQVVYCVSNSLSVHLLIECELAIKYLHNFNWKLLIEATSLLRGGQTRSTRQLSHYIRVMALCLQSSGNIVIH